MSCLPNRTGTPRDRTAAQHHFEAAASASHPLACLWVGQEALDSGCYSLGYSHLCTAADAEVKEAFLCLAQLAEKQAASLLGLVRRRRVTSPLSSMTSSPSPESRSRSSNHDRPRATAIQDSPAAQAELMSLDFKRFASVMGLAGKSKLADQERGNVGTVGVVGLGQPLGLVTHDRLRVTTPVLETSVGHVPPRSRIHGSVSVPGASRDTLQLSKSGQLFLCSDHHQSSQPSKSTHQESSHADTSHNDSSQYDSSINRNLRVAQAAAAQLYARSAAGGDPQAQHWLGNLNWQNDRLDPALDCYYAAAKQGYPPSLVLLGCLSEGMYGFQADLETAEKCYR